MSMPLIKNCLFCEDIRVEVRKLFSLMGVYGVGPWAIIKIRDFNLPVSLCVVFFGGEGEGKSTFRPELRSPDGSVIDSNISPASSEMTFKSTEPFTCGFRISTIFPGPNIYTVALLADNQTIFNSTLKLEQGQVQDFT
jgi:hypothetical protein